MDNNSELKLLHMALFGTELKETKDCNEILSLLKSGKNDIIVDLNWGETVEGKYHVRHKVTIQHIEDDKIIFYNPLGHDEELGKGTITGKENSPKRIVEDSGLESVTVQEFISFFKDRDAICFYP